MQRNSPQVQVRRNKVKKLIARGITPHQIMKTLDISEPTYYKDLKAIRRTILTTINKEPIENILVDLFLTKDTINEKLWDLYLSSNNDNIKLGCLNNIDKSLLSKITILQSLGIVREIPRAISFTNGVTYDALKEAYDKVHKKRDTEHKKPSKTP